MINFNGGVAPTFPEGKAFYVDKFTALVIEHAPEYEHFGIYDLLGKLLDEEDSNRFNSLADIVKQRLVESGVVTRYGSWQYIINEDVRRSILNPKDENNSDSKNITIIGNNAILNQGSSFVNSPISPISNNTNDTPIKKEPKSILEKIWKFTDHKLIAHILIIIIGLVLAYFGIEYLK